MQLYNIYSIFITKKNDFMGLNEYDWNENNSMKWIQFNEMKMMKIKMIQKIENFKFGGQNGKTSKIRDNHFVRRSILRL